MALKELGSGSYEIKEIDGSTSTLIGFVYVEKDTSTHYEEYYVMFSPHTVPIKLANVGDAVSFVLTDDIDGQEPGSPEEMASLVADAYPSETLLYKKTDVTYRSWNP